MAIPLRDQIFGKLLGLHQVIYEKTDGRIGASLAGRPMLLLRTVGRKTGKERTAALLYVEDGGEYAVVASKGGSDVHPGWYFNLTDNPEVEIQVGRDTIPVTASTASGPRREELWAKADKVNSGQYETYQSRTDREIPLVVLTPR